MSGGDMRIDGDAPALEFVDIAMRFGATEVLERIDLAIAPGEIHALIGPNGAGKSTLFDIAGGRLAPSRGRVRMFGRGITGLPPHQRARLGLARGFQASHVFRSLSVRDNLRCAALAAAGSGLAFWRGLNARACRQAHARAAALLEEAGLEPLAGRVAGELAHGDRRRLDLAMAFAGDPRLVLLDEPTAGLDAAETDDMIALLRRLADGRTLLLVEHDLRVVFGLATRVSVLARGGLLASGSPEAVRRDPVVRAAYLDPEY